MSSSRSSTERIHFPPLHESRGEQYILLSATTSHAIQHLESILEHAPQIPIHVTADHSDNTTDFGDAQSAAIDTDPNRTLGHNSLVHLPAVGSQHSAMEYKAMLRDVSSRQELHRREADGYLVKITDVAHEIQLIDESRQQLMIEHLRQRGKTLVITPSQQRAQQEQQRALNDSIVKSEMESRIQTNKKTVRSFRLIEIDDNDLSEKARCTGDEQRSEQTMTEREQAVMTPVQETNVKIRHDNDDNADDGDDYGDDIAAAVAAELAKEEEMKRKNQG